MLWWFWVGLSENCCLRVVIVALGVAVWVEFGLLDSGCLHWEVGVGKLKLRWVILGNCGRPGLVGAKGQAGGFGGEDIAVFWALFSVFGLDIQAVLFRVHGRDGAYYED